MLICISICSQLANLEFYLEGVERLDYLLISHHLVLLLLYLCQFLLLYKLTLFRQSLASFLLLGSHAPFLHLLHVGFESLH